MATAIGNQLGVTIFPDRSMLGEQADGADQFFEKFPDAIMAQLEIKQDEDGDTSAEWFLLVPKEGQPGFRWLPIEAYGEQVKVPPKLSVLRPENY